ncbi:Ribosome biogenesis protein Bms1/Tsr1 [Pleurotus pulmonarius]
MVEAHHHRPTLKQTNKAFKSKHATKSSIRDAAKGRVSRQSPKTIHGSPNAAQTRMNRKNHAKQVQAHKRSAIVSATRLFNGVDGAPRIVAVVPLCPDVSTQEIVKYMAEALDQNADDCPIAGVWKLRAERFRTSLQFITLPYKSFYATLDACKVADYVVFVLSPVVEVDTFGDTLLRTLQAQGLPDVISLIPPTSSPLVDTKTKPGILKSLLSFVQYFVPTQTRVFDLSSGSDRVNAIRTMADGKPADVRWREGRAWVLGDHVEWEDEDNGTLKFTGVVRGTSLSANRLVHLPNYGDFQISKILSAPLPSTSHRASNANHMDVEAAVLAEPDPSDADSLVSSNEPDDMANEQTWPTEEEMNGNGNGTDGADGNVPDAANGATPKRVKRVPKGMSEYQAAWIVEDEDEDEGAEGEGETENETRDGEMDGVRDGEEEEMQDLVVDDDQDMESSRAVHFEDLDNEEEEKQLQTWRSRTRTLEEQDDLQFPDEVDTPKDTPAHLRFQRYRGLQSFRTSPWDPYENLPRDYARIFQFEDFKRTERGVRKRAEMEVGVVEPGVRVTICIRGVPRAAAGVSFPVLFSLMQHEHKMTTLNFTVQRNTEYDGSVRSKDPLILCVGPRRLHTNPIYSQHTRGGGKGANNVHKFERFLRPGITTVATTYGPVVFGNQPCVLLRESDDPQAPHLVAMGSFLNPDTTRVIAKRIILTGHPFKVHKKTATVRYMFFNRDDVHYYKPIQLHTKYGRTGHIRESLGTHGYFKAHFDGPINQMDTVCMSLYKRVFPKWSTLWKDGTEEVANAPSDAMDLE